MVSPTLEQRRMVVASRAQVRGGFIPEVLGRNLLVAAEAAEAETSELLFNSVLLAIKHTVPHMKRGGGGSIVNNASVAAHRVGHGSILYSAAKAAVVAATRVAAVELGPCNIRVNSISPRSRRRSSGAAASMPRPPSAVWRPWPRSERLVDRQGRTGDRICGRSREQRRHRSRPRPRTTPRNGCDA